MRASLGSLAVTCQASASVKMSESISAESHVPNEAPATRTRMLSSLRRIDHQALPGGQHDGVDEGVEAQHVGGAGLGGVLGYDAAKSVGGTPEWEQPPPKKKPAAK